MDLMGNQFFTGPASAFDQDRAGGLCDLLGGDQQIAHNFGLCQDFSPLKFFPEQCLAELPEWAAVAWAEWVEWVE